MARLAYPAISLAAILWAVGAAVARFLIDEGADLVELTEARAWGTAIGLALLLLARRSSSRPAAPTSPLVFVAFGLAIAALNVTYYAAIAFLPVAVAITIEYTAPGLVVLWATVAERRRPTARVLGSLAVAFAGVVFLAELPVVLAGGAATLSTLGLVMAFASAVSFAAYMVIGEKVGRRLGAERALFRGFAVASLFWIGVQAGRGVPRTLLDPAFLPGILFLALGTTLVPFLLFLWGLRHVDASRAGVVSTLEPLAAAVIAYLWLGQVLTTLQLVGAVAVVAGIAIVQSERPEPPEVLAERAILE